MPRWTNSDLVAFEAKQNARTHIQDYPKISHPQQREQPQELARGDAREAQSTGCLRVCFALYRIRLLDVDAKYSSTKDLLDCLTNAGIISGDKEGQITLEVAQIKVASFKDEKTEIAVYETNQQPTEITKE